MLEGEKALVQVAVLPTLNIGARTATTTAAAATATATKKTTATTISSIVPTT